MEKFKLIFTLFFINTDMVFSTSHCYSITTIAGISMPTTQSLSAAKHAKSSFVFTFIKAINTNIDVFWKRVREPIDMMVCSKLMNSFQRRGTKWHYSKCVIQVQQRILMVTPHLRLGILIKMSYKGKTTKFVLSQSNHFQQCLNSLKSLSRFCPNQGW